MRRTKLGTWSTPSGNRCDVFLEPDTGEAVRHLALEWDSPPPLSDSDEAFYVARIFPELMRRTAEYLERPGPAVAVIL